MKFNSQEKRNPNGKQTNQQRLNHQTYMYVCTYWLYIMLYIGRKCRRGVEKLGMKTRFKSAIWVNFFTRFSFFFDYVLFPLLFRLLLVVGFHKLIYNPVSNFPLSLQCCVEFFEESFVFQRRAQILMKYFNYFTINWENIFHCIFEMTRRSDSCSAEPNFLFVYLRYVHEAHYPAAN